MLTSLAIRNVVLIEALDLREAQRAYEANLNVIETARSMEMRTLELLKK